MLRAAFCSLLWFYYSTPCRRILDFLRNLKIERGAFAERQVLRLMRYAFCSGSFCSGSPDSAGCPVCS